MSETPRFIVIPQRETWREQNIAFRDGHAEYERTWQAVQQRRDAAIERLAQRQQPE